MYGIQEEQKFKGIIKDRKAGMKKKDIAAKYHIISQQIDPIVNQCTAEGIPIDRYIDLEEFKKKSECKSLDKGGVFRLLQALFDSAKEECDTYFLNEYNGVLFEFYCNLANLDVELMKQYISQ